MPWPKLLMCAHCHRAAEWSRPEDLQPICLCLDVDELRKTEVFMEEVRNPIYLAAWRLGGLRALEKFDPDKAGESETQE